MYLYPVNLNLAIDIGNTCCKYAVFSGEKILESGSEAYSKEFVEKLILAFPASRIIYASVVALSEADIEFFNGNGFISVRECLHTPVKSEYKTPETLGEDRWAAVCGAAFLSGSAFPFLVIQVGTAITFDYVDEKGHYTGGAISPGISLRFRALHNFTGRLPLVVPEKEFPLMGTTTNDSILSGVLSGCLAEVEFRIDEFRKNTNKGSVFMSGGDQGYFDLSHENNIFAVPDIVLVGLNHLLNLNP